MCSQAQGRGGKPAMMKYFFSEENILTIIALPSRLR